MRVLQLIDSLNAGGAERMAVNLCNALNNQIEQSFICSTRFEGILKESINIQSNYFYLNRKSTLHLEAILKLSKFIKKNNISIIHAHGTSFFLATLMKMSISDISIVWHDHLGNRNNTSFFNKLVLKISSLFFKQIITVNKALEIWSKKHLWCKKVVYLPNFVIHSNCNIDTKLNGIDNKRILCLANLRVPKNHENLIRAFAIVNRKYPKWSLHCVGSVFKDEYSKNIESLILNFELQDCVFLYGSKPDISSIIRQCNIGVLSSDIEGLPMALLEYGMGRLAVVATHVGDCNKVIISNKTGILVNPNDEVALANAMSSYIINEDQSTLMADQLQSHVIENFSEQAIINTVLKQYKAILH